MLGGFCPYSKRWSVGYQWEGDRKEGGAGGNVLSVLDEDKVQHFGDGGGAMRLSLSPWIGVVARAEGQGMDVVDNR